MRRHHARLLLPALVLASLSAACSSTPSTPVASSAVQPTTGTATTATTAATASPMPMASGSSMPTTTSPAAAGSGATLAVTIKDFTFTIPGPVKAGGKITVRNDDSEIHTFTLDGKNPLPVPGHSTATRTAPTQPGKHQVTCEYHGNMHATLTVTT